MLQIKQTASGKTYRIATLAPGEKQYMDRKYRFDYIPAALQGCPHVMTCGDDKMRSEHEVCFVLETDRPVEAYVLYPDKQPVLPGWLNEYERMRMNVTRLDSDPSNLKGYFSIYRKSFSAGEIPFCGNSPDSMLAQERYVRTLAATYCMYSVALVEK